MSSMNFREDKMSFWTLICKHLQLRGICLLRIGLLMVTRIDVRFEVLVCKIYLQNVSAYF